MQRESPQKINQNQHRIFLILIILMGSALRLYDLGAESFWIDEVVMVNLTRGSWETLVESLLRARPPLFPVSGFFWVRLFGPSEYAARLLSAFAGIIAIPLLYAVGRKLIDRNVALIATFFLGLSLFHISHAQSYRYYAWVTMMTLASYLFFVQWLQHGSRRWFLAYLSASILLFYTHTYSLFILVAQGLYFLSAWWVHTKRGAAWLASQLIILAGCAFGLRLIYLDLVLGQDVGLSAPIESIGSQQPWWLLPYTVLGKYMFVDFDLLFTWWQIPATLVGLAILLFFVFSAYRRDDAYKKAYALTLAPTVSGKSIWSGVVALWQDSPLWLISIWFAVPLVLPFALQFFVGPSFEPRYTISALPAFTLLLALIIHSAPVRKLVPVSAMLLAFVIVWLPSMWHYYTWDVLEQWAEVTNYVASNTRDDDISDNRTSNDDKMMFVGKGANSHGNNHLLDAYNFYAEEEPQLCADGVFDLTAAVDNADNTEMGYCLRGNHRVWLVMRYHKIGDVDRMQSYVDQHYGDLIIDRQEFTNIRLLLFAGHAQTASYEKRTD